MIAHESAETVDREAPDDRLRDINRLRRTDAGAVELVAVSAEGQWSCAAGRCVKDALTGR